MYDQEDIEGISAEPVSEHFVVTFIQNKPGEDKGTFARVIHVDAPDHVTAIQYAQRIDMSARAEVMTDWLPPDDMADKILGDNFTLQDLRKLHEKFLNGNTFKAFMMEDYVAIQVAAEKDIDDLNTETINQVITNAKSVGDEAEEFLRKEGNDTT
jgi:hypothetical protein